MVPENKNLQLGILMLFTSGLLLGPVFLNGVNGCSLACEPIFSMYCRKMVTAIRATANRNSQVTCGYPVSAPLQESERVEIFLIEDRFTNSNQGATFHYDTQIYIEVQRKYLDTVDEQIKNTNAAIKADVADVFRLAKPSHMQEDVLGTLSRQIKEVLDHRLLDESKKSMVEKVLITRCWRLAAPG